MAAILRRKEFRYGKNAQSKVVALFKPGTSMKTTSFYVASLWRYCRLIVWEGCDKLEGCDELEGTGEDPLQHWTGGDPLLPGKAGELRAHSDSRDLCPACVDTDELVEVKTNMAMRLKVPRLSH